MLRVDIDPALPAVMADQSQIDRVISNLVTNAVSATPPGGHITVSAHRLDHQVAISVADTGRGIPESICRASSAASSRFPAAPREARGSGLPFHNASSRRMAARSPYTPSSAMALRSRSPYQ